MRQRSDVKFGILRLALDKLEIKLKFHGTDAKHHPDQPVEWQLERERETETAREGKRCETKRQTRRQ